MRPRSSSLLVLMSMATLASVAHAEVKDRIYDFTDAHYLRNGVDVTRIQGRREGTGGPGVIDIPNFPYQRNVRALLTIPAYSDNGSPVFWTVLGDLFPASFTNDSAGRKAKEIADRFPIYVFPTKEGNPIGLGNNRQADIVDMRRGYFSNDPLGLWLHIWVSFTDKAFTSKDGKKALAELQKKNGLALDGTPIVRTVSELENLVSKGFVAKRFRKQDGSEGPMYGICPVIKDPTKGGIAPDAFLAYVRKPDGTPLEGVFLREFASLQTTGRWFSAGRP